MEERSGCCAVVVAAGNSTRMASESPKVFIPLLGIPAIIRTLKAFDQARRVDRVVLVCREADIAQVHQWIAEYGITKVASVVPGGQTRQQSVAAGVNAVPGGTKYLAIHDGARPLILPGTINKAIGDAELYGATAVAIPVKDTIKVAGVDGMILSTPDRSSLWSVQTPQVFRQELYQQAMEKAAADAADYTDDCQLVEHLGAKVHLCTGDYSNLKLTTREDVLAAEAILISRGETA